jgi:hypothetical protein
MKTIFQIVSETYYHQILLEQKIEPHTTFIFGESMDNLVDYYNYNKDEHIDVVIEWNFDYLVNLGLIKADTTFYAINSDYLKFGNDAVKRFIFNRRIIDNISKQIFIDSQVRSLKLNTIFYLNCYDYNPIELETSTLPTE